MLKKTSMVSVILILAMLFQLVPGFATGSDDITTYTPIQVDGDALDFNKAPLETQIDIAELQIYFIPNQGQVDESVKYYASGAGYNFYVTREGVTYAFSRQKRDSEEEVPVFDVERPLNVVNHEAATEGYALKVSFAGANPAPEIEGRLPNSTTVNYFTGSDESKWQTEIPTYEQVVYREIYDGTDLTYHGKDGILKYEFIVAPGADPGQIEMVYQGADSLEVDEAGNLIIATPWGTLQDEKPFVYQLIDGRKTEVKAAFAVKGASVSFTLGDYNENLPLLIDPGLVYSTFLGGSGGETGYSIAVDSFGCAYVTGETGSFNFPTTGGAYDTSFNYIFVTKLSQNGSNLVYSTFMGGNDDYDRAYSIAVDSFGCAYITGFTESFDFPTTDGAFDTSFNGHDDAFVVKLNATGSALLYSTFLGGSGIDCGSSIAVDVNGCAYVTGFAGSSDFPTTTGAYDTNYKGDGDAFIAKLNQTGSKLLYSTFLGGSNSDWGRSIAVDTSGCAYVTGQTSSSNYPTTAGVYNNTYNGGDSDMFVTKLNSTGNALLYSTFLGGSSGDRGYSIAVADTGCAYITGITDSSNFPTTSEAFDSSYNGGDFDAFVVKLNSTGSSLLYSTFLGGSSRDWGYSIAVDNDGYAYITGDTRSTNFPTTPGAHDTNPHWSRKAFVAKLNPIGSNLDYSTFLGGSSSETGYSIAIDNNGLVYITGSTSSSDFTTTPGAYDRSHNGGTDAFIAKLNLNTLDFCIAKNLSVVGSKPLPTLEWYYTDTRNTRMSKYRIIVTRKFDGVVVWDSGEVARRAVNNERIRIAYSGARLDAAQHEFQVWVENVAGQSSWSAAHEFTFTSNIVAYNPYEGVSWDNRMLVQLHAHYKDDWNKSPTYGFNFYSTVEKLYNQKNYHKVFFTEHSYRNWRTWLEPSPAWHVKLFGAVECTGKDTHMLALGITDLVTPYGIPSKDQHGDYLPIERVELSENERVSQIIKQSLSGGAGALAIPAHPNASEYKWPLYTLLDAGQFQAMEIYTGVLRNLPGQSVATDLWDRLLWYNLIVWGVATDDYTPFGGHTSLTPGPDLGAIAIPYSGNTLVYTDSQILNAIRRGAFYATTGSSGPNITVTLDGSDIIVTAPLFSTVWFYNQRGIAKKVDPLFGTSTQYKVSSDANGDRYVRVEVAKGLGRSWSQPIFFVPQGSVSSMIDAGENKSMGLHSITLDVEQKSSDLSLKLSLPGEMLPPLSLPRETVGIPYILEVEEGLLENCMLSISYEYENVIPYFEPFLAVYHRSEGSTLWTKLQSSVEQEAKRVTAKVNSPGWYIIAADLSSIIVPMNATPEVIIIPPEGEEPLSLPFEAEAEIVSDTGIWKMSFYLGDIFLGTDIWPDDGWKIEIDPSYYTSGQYTIKVIAEDLTGNHAEAEFLVNLSGGMSEPYISITNLEEETVLGSTVVLEGEFDVGTDLATIIVGIDDKNLNAAEIIGNNWSCEVNGGLFPAGVYDLWAKVEDEYGNSSKAIIPVTIGPIIKLSSESTIMPVGENIDVWLLTGGLNDNLGKVETILNFDPDQLEILEIVEGDFLSQDEAVTSFIYDLNTETGTLSIIIERQDGRSAPGNGGHLATVVVSVKPGSSTPSILLSDTELYSLPSNTMLDHSIENLIIEVNSPPNVTNLPGYTVSTVGSPFVFQVHASDPDNNDMSFELMSDDLERIKGISIDKDTGLITWAEPVIGQYKVTVLINDGYNPKVHRELDIFIFKYGSVKGDGKIDVSDAILVLRSIVNLVSLDSLSSLAADVNNDGRIDVVDAILILRYVAGFIDDFPVCD